MCRISKLTEELPLDTHPKEFSRPQNEPWEFAAPRGRSYADPTPVRRLGTRNITSNWLIPMVIVPATARSARPNIGSVANTEKRRRTE
jgi:hypothetical protein